MREDCLALRLSKSKWTKPTLESNPNWLNLNLERVTTNALVELDVGDAL